ncbi:MAG: chromate transporter [Chloroflexi bacterium]|nr:MAG: chromate transporter [Chloroflexota bacterium]TMG70735.1 MAG: chromate transporter [Chloroflexota bacterium]
MACTSLGEGGGFVAPPPSWTHICSTGFHVKMGVSARPTTDIAFRLTGMLARLTRSWIAVGTQSVGGGTSTLLLIRRLAVERERWLSGREFGEAWALSQLSPGIHLVALAGLIGRRAAGWRGAAAAVLGMMIPAGAITIALTAAYGSIANAAFARAALAGVGPITGGMTVATALLLIRSTARRGRVHISIDVAVSAVAFVAALAFAIPTVAAIAAGGVIGAFALGREPPTSRQTPMG